MILAQDFQCESSRCDSGTIVLRRLLNVCVVEFSERGLFMIGRACGVDIAARRLYSRSRRSFTALEDFQGVDLAIEFAEHWKLSSSTLTGEYSGEKCSLHSGWW